MSAIKIHPIDDAVPVSYDFAADTFLPVYAHFDKFDVYVAETHVLTNSLGGEDMRFDHNSETFIGTYYGNGNEDRTIKVKLKDILPNDKLRIQYYNSYIVHADDMYDISNTSTADYIKFLKDNPVLMHSINSLYINIINYLGVEIIEGLHTCNLFISDIIHNKDISRASYDTIKKVHSSLVKVLKTIDEMDFNIQIHYKNATINNVVSDGDPTITGLTFKNLIVNYEKSLDPDQYYPTIKISGCEIDKIIMNSNIRKLLVDFSEIGEFESNNHTIFGSYLDVVNHGSEITLPNSSNAVYICAIDTIVNVENYKQMVEFSKKNVVNVYTEQEFLNKVKRDKITDTGIGNTGNGYGGSRFEKLKGMLNCDAVIISNDPRILSFKYHNILKKYPDMPKDMMELLTVLLSK
jgi:hypothetical protein